TGPSVGLCVNAHCSPCVPVPGSSTTATPVPLASTLRGTFCTIVAACPPSETEDRLMLFESLNTAQKITASCVPAGTVMFCADGFCAPTRSITALPDWLMVTRAPVCRGRWVRAFAALDRAALSARHAGRAHAGQHRDRST